MSKRITTYFSFESKSKDNLSPTSSNLVSTPADKRRFSSSSPTSDSSDPTPKRAYLQDSPSNMAVAEETQWIREALQDIKTELKALASAEDVRKLASELREQVAKMEGTILDLHSELSRVKTENKALKERITDVESEMNRIEQYDRRRNVRVFNMKENRGESFDGRTKMCCDLFTEIGVPTKETDVEAVHRIGLATEGRTRPIIVRFSNRQQRDKVMANRRKLKGRGVAISEDLTTANYLLERAAYKHSATNATWTSNGNVFAK